MPKLKTVREQLLIGHAFNVLNDEEFCLLYDANKSKNPDFHTIPTKDLIWICLMMTNARQILDF